MQFIVKNYHTMRSPIQFLHYPWGEPQIHGVSSASLSLSFLPRLGLIHKVRCKSERDPQYQHEIKNDPNGAPSLTNLFFLGSSQVN